MRKSDQDSYIKLVVLFFIGTILGNVIYYVIYADALKNKSHVEYHHDLVLFIIQICVLATVSLVALFYLRRKHMNLMRISNQRDSLFHSIVENIPITLFAKDIQNNFRYSYLNKSAEVLFGHPRDEMIGKTDYDYFVQDEADFFRNTDISVVNKGQLIDIPSENVTTSVGPIIAHTRKIVVYDSEGKPETLLGILEDITERRRNEAELQRYREELEVLVYDRTEKLHEAMKKAEELSRLKSEFLATMSHEIRTPMNGILGMAELILGMNQNKAVENHARTIIHSGEVLLSIINDILDFSKIEAGKMEIEPMEVDLLDLVDDIARIYSLKARDKAIELAVRYVPGTEQFVFGDPLRLRQILGNMVNNAIKFTDRGHITITVEADKTKPQSTDHVTLKISVADTGIGISDEAKMRVFEKFSQADASTTRKYGGTGLGLSICHALVQLMHGDIGVESAKGEGATFWFTVPFKRNAIQPKIKAIAPILNNLRMLVVDDFDVIRTIVTEQMSDAGLRCDAASSGEEALYMMRQAVRQGDPYKIVIIDYLMPSMDGEMLACAINDDLDISDSCLVMLTAAGSPLADDQFAAKGFSAYFPKPVQQKALIDGLAIVWSRYSAGEKNVLIRVDPQALGNEAVVHDEPQLPGRNILIAEDNLVNQVFIREILEEMKCAYVVVSNGEEAVRAVQNQKFDLIIMDCLMPEMDGFDATRDIRKLEHSVTNGKVVPVLALTANAMKGDRERCLAAGMNNYLSKPVRKRELKDMLYQMLLGETQGTSSEKIVTLEVQKPPILDIQAVEDARSILKGKYENMVKIYIENCHERLSELRDAIAHNNIANLVRPAHTLKSISRQMGVMRLGNIAMDIEYAAKGLTAGAAEPGKDVHYIETCIQALPDHIHEAEQAFSELNQKQAGRSA